MEKEKNIAFRANIVISGDVNRNKISRGTNHFNL